jgi:ABC-type uncharacterized transport system substrate-binding protein
MNVGKAPIAFFLILFLAFTGVSAADHYKVLVVMSYEQDNPWCEEIKQGIESVLGGVSDITYAYMDTKINFEGGQAKADLAYEQFKQLQPDGVITADDNAQWMFVVPYLKDKVDTPVMFCGVNAEAQKYGFPASNVSGSLERGHVNESIAFIKQLKADVQRVCFLVKQSPSGDALEMQVEDEKRDYIAKVNGFFKVKSMSELGQLAPTFQSQCDAIYMDSLEGIMDDQGNKLDHRQIFVRLEQLYSGPFIGANKYHVDQGALSAVVKTGQEQGELAAGLLLRAMQGTPVSQLAVTRNYQGRRIINVTTLEKLGIKPRPIVLRGTTLVKTPE